MSDQGSTPAAQGSSAPRRVVVAEDESLIRLDIVETLRDNGFEVVGEAADGETAVALATELRPDLVIMDVKMPQLDGISAAERLTKNKELDSRIEARSIHQVSRSYRGGRSFLKRSTRYRGGVENVLRKMHEKLDR